MKPPQNSTLPDRYWSKVSPPNKDGCMVWNGGRIGRGYGQFRIGRKRYLAHLLALIDVVGAISPKTFVLHICDNPPCVTPGHLKTGTHEDNMIDMTSKGRSLTGEKQPGSKLVKESVIEIRRLYSLGLHSQGVLAKEYGVDKSTIRRIISRELWKHIA